MSSNEKPAHGFKGFDKDLKCRGMQYEVGKEFTADGEISCCNNGLHMCERPLDVFGYYPPATSRYCTVDGSGDRDDDSGDSKIAFRQLKVTGEIGIPGLVKAHIEYTKAHTTNEHTDPKQATAGGYGAATAGEYGAATAGEYGAATAGNRGVATAGNRGAATAGEYGAATAGNRGVATAGNRGAATAGEYGAATAGNRGAATAGDSGAATAGDSGAATAGGYGAATAGNRGAATAGEYGAATSRGSVSVGKNGVGLVRGNGVRAKGGVGAILVIAEENDDDYDIKAWKAVVVDGETIKADTFYTLKDGELVKADASPE